MRRAVFAGLALALACAPLDYTGKRCSAERPCPAGWACKAEVCVASGGVNRVVNGGFEDGARGWVVTGGALATADGGYKSPTAGLWQPAGAQDSVLTSLGASVDVPARDGWHCAQAWVSGSDGLDLDLELRVNGEANTSSTVQLTPGAWKRVTTVTNLDTGPISLALVSYAAQGARSILVDELAIWNQPGLDCSTPP